MKYFFKQKNKWLARPSAGMTLIELLLYVSLSGILIFGVVMLFLTLGQSRVKQFSVDNVENEGQFVLEKFSYLLHNSYGVSIPAASAQSAGLTFNYPTAFDTAKIYLTGTTLYLERNGVAEPLNSPQTEASNLTFINNSSNILYPSVRINFTLNAKNSAGRSEFNYSDTFYATANSRKN